jgi:hypothetical protein
MQKYLSDFEIESQKKLKSTYFDSIHSMENMNVFSLIKYSMSLEKEKRVEKSVLRRIEEKLEIEKKNLEELREEIKDSDE